MNSSLILITLNPIGLWEPLVGDDSVNLLANYITFC